LRRKGIMFWHHKTLREGQKGPKGVGLSEGVGRTQETEKKDRSFERETFGLGEKKNQVGDAWR